MNTLIAIDPGLNGGIAYLRDGQPAEPVPMPATEGDTVNLLRQLAADPANAVAFVEEVGGYVGKAQPASSAFKFGRNFGFLLGVLQTLGVRVELVSPKSGRRPWAWAAHPTADRRPIGRTNSKPALSGFIRT